MNEQWQELKETIIELRDGDGTGTQQEVCKFLANYMDILEKQMQEPCEDAISRQAAIDALGERHTVWTTDGERRRIGMRKSVRVIDSYPTANKKGLRIKVESVELDENNNLLALHIDYSGLHERGGGIVEVAQRNKFDLPEE